MSVFYKNGSSDLNFLSISRASANLSYIARACLKGVLLASVLLSAGVSAQTISPQMMQQFKSMPRAQQEALAAQYGIDLDQALGGGARGVDTDIAIPGEPLEQRTQLDIDLESEQNYQ